MAYLWLRHKCTAGEASGNRTGVSVLCCKHSVLTATFMLVYWGIIIATALIEALSARYQMTIIPFLIAVLVATMSHLSPQRNDCGADSN